MRSIKSEAGFFGNFLSFFVLFLSTTNLVLSVPVTIQARGGPSICGLPLKASNYRQTCLGNPQTGILAQAGLASSVGASGLVWQSSQRMSQTMQYLTSRKEASSVHCDHVLEVQYINAYLRSLDETFCGGLAKTSPLYQSLKATINGKDNLLLLDGEVNKIKGRYTTRVMTATRNEVQAVLPVMKDARLSSGLVTYFSRIQTQQLKVASEISRLTKAFAPPGSIPFDRQARTDFLILNEFFQTYFKQLQGKGVKSLPDWAEAVGGGEIAPNAQYLEDLELAFEEDDEDESDQPLTPLQMAVLQSRAPKAVSKDPPEQLRRSTRLQNCKRLANGGGNAGGGEEATDGLSCQLPNSNSQVASQVDEDSNPTRGATTPQSPALDSEPINDEGNLATPNSRLPPSSTLRSSPMPTQPLALSKSRLNNLAFTSPTSILTSPRFYPTSALRFSCSFAFQLLEKDPDLRVHCCDFSPRAVELVKTHPNYTPERVNAFVYDLTTSPSQLPQIISSSNLPTPTFISTIFVLSAIQPDLHLQVLSSLVSLLPKGGSLLFRDYAYGDLAQLRFHSTTPGSNKVEWHEPSLLDKEKHWYKRGDGTLTYFFKKEELEDFAERLGLEGEVRILEKVIKNRKMELEMKRRWTQVEWKKA